MCIIVFNLISLAQEAHDISMLRTMYIVGSNEKAGQFARPFHFHQSPLPPSQKFWRAR
jgi:hypothetical protein